ncbi:hypothetical protein LOTGIDRAFT_232526 [Lottia gigantea]|uniref:Delta(3,5)-Delta(2,4)-dienoyl-CoA isomerase, mitochondrial n=1 Tax=Lottia gigantea TaxID=225164 RepID=V4BYT3_LOTGI|nr:hypothetical protein LOTGIDRAFT_232526 [Lottia gigantea]ESO94289.1 hypothetical protein LOTGIDRAFT_232526 [Lottia gigantea]
MFTTKVAGILKGLTKPSVLKMTSRMCSTATSTYNFETLKVTQPREFVLQVEINRPEKRNAMNQAFWREMVECFNQISDDSDCRAVIFTGSGKIFTAGLDLMDMDNAFMQSDLDVGRKAMKLRKLIRSYQESFTAIEKCPKPVIACVHSACVGGGIDLIAACDMRYSSSDAWFCVKEVDIGLAADVGTLQRLPKIIGNDSIARELAYTARKFFADEAKQIGLIGRIFENKETMIQGALDTASLIASKSPIAVQGTKVCLVYARDHGVSEGLDQMVTWNQNMLQSEDLMKAMVAGMDKKAPVFSKL